MSVNINNNSNQVTAVNANQNIVVTNHNNQTSVSVAQPVTNIVEVVAAGPQGPQGASGASINTSTFATTGSNTFIGTQTVTGSVNITGSLTVNTVNVGQNTLNFIDNNGNIVNSLSISGSNLVLFTGSISTTSGGLTGSLFGTASWAQNVISSSYALTASFALNGGGSSINTSSFVQNSQTSSFVTNSQTSSFVLNNATSSFVTNSQTSSFVQNSQTSSMLAPYVLNSQTSSFATTGSNTFNGNQTITGSLTLTNNLIVLGSASITYISQSTLNIGTNLITVNTDTPSVRFGGLSVIDSGSTPQRSGSILFDSQNNQWVFVHQSPAGQITSSVFIQGPQTFNNIGNETTLSTNRIPKAIGGDLGEHIGDSNIIDTGTIVSINSNTQITGSLFVSAGLTGSFTGSLIGTSSWATQALTASFAPNYVLNSATSSFVINSQTSSFVQNSQTSSFVLNSQTSSMTVLSSSFALTASFALNAGGGGTTNTASLLTTASATNNIITFTKGDASTFTVTVATGSGGGGGATFPFTGSAIITGSLVVTGSLTTVIGNSVELQVTNTGVNMGSIITDNHSITGSLRVSGSISGSLSGSVTGDIFAASTTAGSSHALVVVASGTTGVKPLLNTLAATIGVTPSTGTLIARNLSLSGSATLTGSFNQSGSHNIYANQNSVTQADTNGMLLGNFSAATVGVQSISPPVVWQGNGWQTGTGGSQDVRFRADVLPIQGTTNPNAAWKLSTSINGGAYTERMGLYTFGATAGFTYLDVQSTSQGQIRVGSLYANSLVGAGDQLAAGQPLSGGTYGTYSFRLTSAGGTIAPKLYLWTNSSTAGQLFGAYDTTNGYILGAFNAASNGIARASINIINLVNTTASESADLAFYTKPGSPANTAPTERMRITSTGTTIFSGSVTFAAPTSPAFNGEIVQFGAGTLTTGQLYFLSSSGTWSLANANTTGSSIGMLGLAVGSSPTTNGLLIRGFASSGSYPTDTGSIVYAATSSGLMTTTSPSSSNHVVRVLGYVTTLPNTIYFDPDKTWVTLA